MRQRGRVLITSTLSAFVSPCKLQYSDLFFFIVQDCNHTLKTLAGAVPGNRPANFEQETYVHANSLS